MLSSQPAGQWLAATFLHNGQTGWLQSGEFFLRSMGLHICQPARSGGTVSKRGRCGLLEKTNMYFVFKFNYKIATAWITK